MKCSTGSMWDFEGDFPRCRSTSLVTRLFADDNDNVNVLDSRCRRSTNLITFFMTELNGINVIIKLIIIGLYLKKNIKRSKVIAGLIILLAIHTFIHILIIIASLPQLCDSSNMNWKEGTYFNYIRCHWKSNLYYSTPFWFIDNIVPGIILILSLVG